MVGAPELDGRTSRVLQLFSLTVPPLVILLITYVALTEHVFGMSYLIGRRMGKRTRRPLRFLYVVITSLTAGMLHAAMLSRCILVAPMDESAFCPDVPMTEQRCLAPSAVTALAMFVALWVERVVGPMLDLTRTHPYKTGTHARTINAAALSVVWFCMSEQQTGALLLLGMMTARRALVLLPRCNKFYGILMKLYTVIHMSRVLAHRCEASRRLSVATVVAILSL